MKKYIKSFIYGGLDGIITTFAVVAGSTGANLGFKAILALGISNLLADGFSMAMGDYISSKSDPDEENPKKNAIVTFISFAIFGFILIVSYLLPIENNYLFACILTATSLGLLGYFKARILEINKFKSILDMLILGGIAALISFYIGELISKIL